MPAQPGVVVQVGEWVFGGFTPGPASRKHVQLRVGGKVGFLFTLKNPNNVLATRYLAAGMASTNNPGYGPTIGNDLLLAKNCNANANSNVNFPTSLRGYDWSWPRTSTQTFRTVNRRIQSKTTKNSRPSRSALPARSSDGSLAGVCSMFATPRCTN